MIIKHIILSFATLALLAACDGGYKRPDSFAKTQPHIYPDYAGVTLPCNIAPTNFRIEQMGDAYQVIVESGGKEYFRFVSADADVEMPEDIWHEMLDANKGGKITVTIGVKRGGKWTEYRPITNMISRDTIDSYLAYRLIYPGYELWNEMGIYQRNLTNFDEITILDNHSSTKRCLNCHTFRQNSTTDFMVHVRGKNGGTLISQGGSVRKVTPRCPTVKNGATYARWHPSGQFIAFSMNEIQQFFHSSGQKPVEVSDLAADLGVYDIKHDVIITSPELSGDNAMETFPEWSVDGKTLFYCRGNAYTKQTPLDSIRYDLWSVSFDAKTQQFGTPKCVYNASAKHHSVSLPRVSPDGRYIVFVESNYGNFSIWHTEADLVMLDLKTGGVRPLDEINSRNVESFHTWSSTGRWMVFSSKRMDGGWARPYFAHFDKRTGRFTKPFVLPQKSPTFYDTFMKTYNLPELITSPVVNQKELQKAIEN